MRAILLILILLWAGSGLVTLVILCRAVSRVRWVARAGPDDGVGSGEEAGAVETETGQIPLAGLDRSGQIKAVDAG
jgi:hypothetical protein